jgi:wyosine [tRNA(Phe)-imidazoG37] synthetase (radical SAM superfamily)
MGLSTATVCGLRPNGYSTGMGILYGPVQSRRLGFSLGVNLLACGEKTCNFDCLYCELGWTPWMEVRSTWFPSLEILEETLSEDLPGLARRYPSLDAITLSGNGEPTLFPEFADAVRIVAELRKRYCPCARLAILTNGSRLGDKAVFEAMRGIDLRCVKFDAGGAWMNRPRESVNLEKLIPTWAEMPNLTIQSFFSEGRFDNTLDEWVDPWVEQLKTIRPRRVQLYSLDRTPAVGAMVKAPLSTLSHIGRRVASAVCTEVQVFD